jgi:hypothetical protein
VPEKNQSPLLVGELTGSHDPGQSTLACFLYFLHLDCCACASVVGPPPPYPTWRPRCLGCYLFAPRRPTAPRGLKIWSAGPDHLLRDFDICGFYERLCLRRRGISHARPSSAATHPLLLIAPERSSSLLCETMTWPSDGLSSPSMANPSIPGSTPRARSTIHATSPDVPADKKRKNGLQDQGRTPAQKRLKPMGRPRNGWTPTRKRKLVRLYLMTELNVGEIAEVLRGKSA